MPTAMQTRILECAAQIVGGVSALCERLQVDEPQLREWLAGKATCPLPQFLEAVDIILESEQGFAAIFSGKAPRGDDAPR